MGTWGVGNFENDDALDWTFSLDHAADTELLESTLDNVLEFEGQPDSPQACEVLAAAEVVAALGGKFNPADLPEEVKNYIKRVGGPPSDNLMNKSRLAVEKVRSDSELRELWDEAGSLDAWFEIVDGLLARLQ